jgi:uncharacterized iron-regulated protein
MVTEKVIQEQLYNSRLKLKREMQRAISCISKPSRRKLAAEWKKTYSEIFYQELINCARNKQVKFEIANWDNERMGKP